MPSLWCLVEDTTFPPQPPRDFVVYEDMWRTNPYAVPGAPSICNTHLVTPRINSASALRREIEAFHANAFPSPKPYEFPRRFQMPLNTMGYWASFSLMMDKFHITFLDLDIN